VKTKFQFIQRATLALTAGLAISCAKSSDGGGANAPLPAAGIVTTCVGATCPTLNNARFGFYAQTSNISSGLSNNGSLYQPAAGFGLLLSQAMGVCDRELYTGGYAACAAWIAGFHDIVLLADNAQSNSVKLVMRSYPQTDAFWYSYQLPAWDQFFAGLIGFPIAQSPQGFYNPMILDATVWPVNNSQGFEIRAYGPRVSAGYNKLIQIQVAQGKLDDPAFNFTVFWNGSQVAQGRMVRCQSLKCGL
jgi:hypothetical protein